MFDLGFGLLAFFCVRSSGFRRKLSILGDFGAKRKKEGLAAAKLRVLSAALRAGLAQAMTSRSNQKPLDYI